MAKYLSTINAKKFREKYLFCISNLWFMNLSKTIPFIVVIIMLSSCRKGMDTNEGNTVDLKIRRFEQDLFSIDIYNISDSLTSLQSKYPDFLPLFNNLIIEIGSMDQPDYAERLLSFVTDFTIYQVSKRVNEVFEDFSEYKKELSKAFGRYNYFFPDKAVPEIITCITGFNQSIVTADSMLVIGLDKYLGSEDEFYKLMYPPVPEYLRYVMHPQKIPSDALYAWLTTEFEYNNTKDNLLSNMIFQGRAYYVTKQLMPEIQDTLLWGFTPKQIDFCSSNEKEMWKFIVEQKRLFITDKLVISQYVSEGPFTKDFSQESPGRTGIWLGYQIVASYMKNNKEVSISDLMHETEYIQILNLSKYNP